MEKVLVIDFGGQYNQLIARRVRECNVYCEVKPYTMPLDEIKSFGASGIIFTGGPATVNADGAPMISKEIFELGIPVLGICYGAQLMAHLLEELVRPTRRNTAARILHLIQNLLSLPASMPNPSAG